MSEGDIVCLCGEERRYLDDNAQHEQRDSQTAHLLPSREAVGASHGERLGRNRGRPSDGFFITA